MWEYSPYDDCHQKVVMCSNSGDEVIMKVEFKDKYGYPVECIIGRPITNFIRRLIHTKKINVKTNRVVELENALNDLLNDCINFDGGKLTDCIMEHASKTLKKYDA